MERRFPWFWIGLAGLVLLAPGPASRFLLDVLGGLSLLILFLPLLLAGGGWLAWRLLRSRVRICPCCGTSTFAADVCPACGSSLDVSRQAATVIWEPFSPLKQASTVESSLFGFRVGQVPHRVESVPSQDSDTPASDVTIDIQARPVGD
jgi:rRNA maturation protein Nop10